MLVTPDRQWNWFKESNVFDPSVSQQNRIGHWRSTKTWYLRSQWAYVPEGSTSAVVIAWQPWFSWTTTYHLKRCAPLEEMILSQDRLWFSNWWGQKKKKWSIQDWAGMTIATADHTKNWNSWNWGWGAVPNGWHSVVTSNVQPGLEIGNLAQSYNSYWVRDSVWMVNDTRPDVVQPYVLSFLASSIDLAVKDSRRRGHRRLNSKEEPKAGAASVEELD
jgi:hypothetical protein